MIGNAKGSPKRDQKKPSLATAFVRHTNRVADTVLRGIKMAQPAIYDSMASPLALLDALKQLGPEALAWKPETLFSTLDQRFGGWSAEKAAEALERFHASGVMQTDIPAVNRHKLYALRIIITSDSAHHEWNVFEKVGSAFNDRPANFGIVEPLSTSECARTVALIDAIRPDEFSNEIKAYIAAACHLEGLYTAAPSKYLKMADPLLSMMNREETGRQTDDKIVDAIAAKFAEIKAHAATLKDFPEEFTAIQAIRLLAIDRAGDDAVYTEEKP